MANNTNCNSDLAYADGKGDPNPESDLGRIIYAFRKWREEPQPDWRNETKQSHVPTPGRYVGAEAQEEDDEPFTEKYPKLLAELEECLTEGERLTAVVREKLENLGAS